MNDPKEDTIDWVVPKKFADHFFAPDGPKFEVGLAAATHPGKVRPRNEDHYAVFRRTRGCEILSTNLKLDTLTFVDDHAYCMVVADGMGGAAFGDFASQLALSTMLELARRATSWVMKFTDLDAQEVRDRVSAYVDQIQKTLRDCSRADPRLRGMGTTLTCAYLLPPHVVFLHVGDSRAYLHRGGQLKQITRDQTLAQDMVDMGAAPEDVKRFGNLLTNSFGGEKDHVRAEVIHAELQAKDRLLLCTDGLNKMVDDQAIAEILETGEVQRACDQLVQAALERGGKDNITVVLCDLLAAANG
jgi:protein phosphatase